MKTKKKLPVRFTGQHFTIDKVLIKDAIRQANISNQDTVLDIGAWGIHPSNSRVSTFGTNLP